MRVLPENFNDGGFEMSLLERHGNLAIYEQRKNSRAVAFEVVIIRPRKDRTLPNGNFISGGEYYPCPSEFGTYGWACESLERARQRLSLLTERHDK